MIEYKGNKSVEELSGLLKEESPRGVVIVAAAFFDDTLARLLGDKKERSFFDRISDARDWGLLTQHEHDDLQSLRGLRNKFAHDIRVNSFDNGAGKVIEAMNMWSTVSRTQPAYLRLFPRLHQRLLYTVGIIAFRLQHRAQLPAKPGPLPEPDFIYDAHAWPPVTNL
jgi:hypothetical protein